MERDTRVTEQDLLDFTLALRTRLKEEPNDYRGWLLLGRLTLDGNDPEMAARRWNVPTPSRPRRPW